MSPVSAKSHPPRPIARSILAAGSLVLAATPVLGTVAQAQPDPAYDQAYPGQPPAYPGQAQNYPSQNYQGQNYHGQNYQDQPQGADYRNPPPPPEPAPPAGYDGRNTPPPPPGYAPSAQESAAQQAADARYAYAAEQWERANCVKAHGDVGAGAVIGGIFGAIVGSSLGGWHDRGGATLAGAAVGAAGGAAIASASNGDTSPGCPAGYVVRRGAYAYDYAPAGYYYAAPSWYVPWVFVGGAWAFRPYPYHDYYFRTYRGGYGGYRGGYGGYRGGYHGGGYRR